MSGGALTANELWANEISGRSKSRRLGAMRSMSAVQPRDAIRAAVSVLRRSMAMVSGPTPPGTGVM